MLITLIKYEIYTSVFVFIFGGEIVSRFHYFLLDSQRRENFRIGWQKKENFGEFPQIHERRDYSFHPLRNPYKTTHRWEPQQGPKQRKKKKKK